MHGKTHWRRTCSYNIKEAICLWAVSYTHLDVYKRQIYYKQISEGYSDKDRYQIMKKVGMDEREVRRAIKTQILLVFFLPLLTAVIHVAVAFHVMTQLLEIMYMFNSPLVLLCTGVTILVFAIFYALVFAVTSREYYRIVK